MSSSITPIANEVRTPDQIQLDPAPALILREPWIFQPTQIGQWATESFSAFVEGDNIGRIVIEALTTADPAAFGEVRIVSLADYQDEHGVTLAVATLQVGRGDPGELQTEFVPNPNVRRVALDITVWVKASDIVPIGIGSLSIRVDSPE